MRAVVLDSVPGAPRVTEVDVPRPGPGELLVRVATSSINGVDVATASGQLLGLMEHRLPLVVGRDFAGIVEALGEGVGGFVGGDRVFGVATDPFPGGGALAEFVTVPASYGVALIPDGLSLTQAGALGLAGTAAVDSLNAVALREGETVLVVGATGGVGALAVQMAAGRDVRVIATARPGTEVAYLTGLVGLAGGLVDLVDYTGDLPGQVLRLAPGGVDAVLHLAGDGAQLAGLLRPGGRIASTLDLTKDPLGPDVSEATTVHTVLADPSLATLTGLAQRAASGELQVPISAIYPLERASKAFADFTAGTLGKLAVTCS